MQPLWRSPKRNKYGNTRSTCQLGHSHRSKLESAVCQILMLRGKAQELELVQIEDTLYLSDARIKYIADFKCLDLKTQEFFWVEAKGFESPRWPIIQKLWSFYGPGKLEIWKGTHLCPCLEKTISGKLSGGIDEEDT